MKTFLHHPLLALALWWIFNSAVICAVVASPPPSERTGQVAQARRGQRRAR